MLSRNMSSILTMGSCGIGRADMFTSLSAPIPGAFKVQARVPLEIQDIY